VLIDKYGLDAETLLNSILNQNLKNIKWVFSHVHLI
jgi:hypothetical protein